MYSAVLAAHSWVRWAIVVLAVVAVLRAITGWQNRRPWMKADERAGLLLGIGVDLQVVLGLLLYFVYSPYTAMAMDDFGSAMRLPDPRFWAVEHVLSAVAGVGLVH